MRSLKPFSSIIVVALATLAFAATLRGFSPDPEQGGKPFPQVFVFKWWLNEKYKKELALTADQSRRIEEAFQKALPRLKVLKSALDEAESKFDRLVERGDDALVMDQINVLEAARMELKKSQTLMLYDMQKLLTRSQWAKFKAMHQQMERPPAPAAAAPAPTTDRPK